jgi:hypothetical protein
MPKQNKKNSKKNNKTNMKECNTDSFLHKIIKNMRLISLGLIIVFALYLIFQKFGFINITWPSFFYGSSNQNNLEGFANPGLGMFFGNCLYTTNDLSTSDKNRDIELSLSKDEPYVDIDLPNESKLTGFKVDAGLSNNSDGSITLNANTMNELKIKINHHKEDNASEIFTDIYNVPEVEEALNFIENQINSKIEEYKSFPKSELSTNTTTTDPNINLLKDEYNDITKLQNKINVTIEEIKININGVFGLFVNGEIRSLESITVNITDITDSNDYIIDTINDDTKINVNDEDKTITFKEIGPQIKERLLNNFKTFIWYKTVLLFSDILNHSLLDSAFQNNLFSYIDEIINDNTITKLNSSDVISKVQIFSTMYRLKNNTTNIENIDFTETIDFTDSLITILYFKLDKPLVVNNTKYHTVSNGTKNIYYIKSQGFHYLYVKTNNTQLNTIIVDDLIFNIDLGTSLPTNDIYSLNNNWIRYNIESITTLSFDELKYSFEIGSNNNDLKSVINSANYNKFKFGETVIDTALFENKDGTPKYVGNKVRITVKNMDIYKEVMSNTQKIPISVQLYGLDVYAPDYKEYSGNYDPKDTEDSSDISDYDSNTKVLSLISNENRKVIAIAIPNHSGISGLLKVKYSNTFDNNTRKYVVRGPVQEGFNVKNNDIIYFNKPIIANKIYFNTDITGTTPNTNSTNIKVYLAPVGKRDEINFKLKSGVDDGKTKGLDVEGEKCPNTQQMIQKQLQAQQICEALEYKDRIKNAKVVYEKEKEYLKKLARQEKELKQLEGMINKIIARKNKRVSENQYYNVEQLDKELRKIEASRKKAEQDLLETKKAHDIKVDLKLDPQYTDILKKYEEGGLL